MFPSSVALLRGERIFFVGGERKQFLDPFLMSEALQEELREFLCETSNFIEKCLMIQCGIFYAFLDY